MKRAKPKKHRPRAAKINPAQLVDYARQFYERRWMSGTAGNLSFKLKQSPLTITITPSGLNKGFLKPKDLIVLTDGKPPKNSLGRVPSAETAIHQAIHRTFPETTAVFHVHPVYPTLLSQSFGVPQEVKAIPIDWFEMMKCFGVKENQPSVLPIFPNWQDIDRLAAYIADYFKSAQRPILPAILLYNHGVTSWGRTPEEARNHLEAIDYVSEYLFLKRLVKS